MFLTSSLAPRKEIVMTDQPSKPTGSRRCFLEATAAGAVGLALGRTAAPGAAAAQQTASDRQTVRDKLWIFTCVAGADNEGWGLPGKSRMTPAEGAFYLGVPNLLMIQWQGQPSRPFDQYAIPFRPLKRVVWSLVGSGGKTDEEDRKAALDLARRFPNMVGFIMDDFFHHDGSGSLTPEQLESLRE